MKTKLFLFAFCFIFINNAFAINKATEFKASFNPPTIPSLIQACDNYGLLNDGFTEFNIDYYVGNISGYTIDYFSDPAHSTSIYSPYVNEVPQNQTIYYTITDGAAYTASGTITLVVIPVPTPSVSPPVINGCDDSFDDGYAIVDLTQNASYILNGETHAQLLYYTNYYDAFQGGTTSAGYISTPTAANVNGDVYVRVQWDPNYYVNFISSDGQPCAVVVAQPVTVNPLPLVVSGQTFLGCETGSTGIFTFDLTSYNDDLLDTTYAAVADCTFTYYEDSAYTMQIANPSAYQNTSNPQTLYVEITNNITGCKARGSFDIQVNTKPTYTAPTPLVTCDTVNDVHDGIYDGYDLTQHDTTILGVQPAPTYTVTYYESDPTVTPAPSAIATPANYGLHTQTIWAVVTNTSTGCTNVGSFNMVVEPLPTPVVTASNNSICIDFNTGLPLTNVTLTATNATPTTAYHDGAPVTYSYQWYQNGVPIVGATNSTYTIAALSPGMSHDFTVSMTTTTPGFTCSATSSPQTINVSSPASAVGAGYSIVDNAGNQTVTVLVQGFGIYEYSLDGGPRQTSNVFTNVPLGNHIIIVWDVESPMNGCNPLVIENIVVTNAVTPAPTGSSDQFFTQGQTLANLVVNGQNIQWYASATGNKNSSSVAALPSNTLLQDNVTYYATQQVGGYESIDRLPVTAHLVLANANFQSNFAALFPNPANDVLNVKSKESIRKIEITNLLGQKVLTQEVNNVEFSIAIDKLPAQQYLVTLFSDSGKTQVVKIIKK